MLDRVLPYDRDAELAVIGCIILNPNVYDDVAPVVQAGDFFDDANRILFDTLHAMHSAGERIDVVLLTDRLRANGVFEQTGGMAYLYKVANSVPNAAHARYYAGIVAREATRRRLIEIAEGIARQAYEQTDVDELVGNAESSILAVRNNRQTNGVRTFSDCLTAALDLLDAKRSGKSQHLVPTGFPELDRVIGGFQPGRLYIIGARTSVGKTALCTTLARNVAETGRPVLAVSMEMSGEELANRIVSASADVALSFIDNGTVSDSELQRIIANAEKLARLNLSILDREQVTIASIASRARRVKRNRGGLALIAIDYLQLIEPADRKPPRHEQVAALSLGLKRLARSLDAPVLCLAQLNRLAEQDRERPRMKHLRESGAIEQDADAIFLLHRADKDSPDAELWIEKNRSGPIGMVKLRWTAEFARFDSAADPRQGAAGANF